MNWQLIVWIYVALLLVGGVFGFVKAGSKVSLIASIASAIPLALTAAGVLPFVVAPVVVGLLVVQFAIRLTTTKKFMPSGMLLLLSVVTLVAIVVLERH